MIVRALITLVLAVPAFWLTLRYNMHMFQLNGYINKEQTAWLRKNRHLQWILWFAMILGLVRMILPAQLYGVVDIVLDVLIWLTLIVIILVYRLMVEMNSKKPLKFTPRVKRMIGTDIFVCLAHFRNSYATTKSLFGDAMTGNVTFFVPFFITTEYPRLNTCP